MKKINKIDINVDGELINQVKFNVNDLNIIYGEETEESTTTSNSLGKSTALEFVDYLYGKKNPYGRAFEHKNINISGEFEDKSMIIRDFKTRGTINDKEIKKVADLTLFLGIDRSIASTFFHHEIRKNIISYDKNAKDSDYKQYFKVLKLNDLLRDFESLLKTLEKKNQYKKIADEHAESSSNLELDDEIKSIEYQLKAIKNNDLIEIEKSLNKNYEEKTLLESKRKQIKIELEKCKIELRKIDNYINNAKYSAPNIGVVEIYKQFNKELGTFIKKNIEEVSQFHVQYSRDTLKRLEINKKNLKVSLESLEVELNEIENKLPHLNELLSEGNIMKQLFENYQDLSNELVIKLQQKDSAVDYKSIQIKISKLNENISRLNTKFLECEEELNITFKKYSNYSQELINALYDGKFNSKLQLKHYEIKGKHKYPFKFDFKVSKDAGEAVSQIKNIIVDLIVFKYTEEVSISMWDSKCFNGIDPKQIRILFDEISKICKEQNKMAIVSASAFQLNESIINKYNDKVCLKLDENNTLLNFEFDL